MVGIDKRAIKRITKEENIKIFNIVITPTSSQQPERYIKMFTDLYNQGIDIKTYGDKHTSLKSLYGTESHIMHGLFVNFLQINPKLPTYDKSTKTSVKIEYDTKFGPNSKDAIFYFIPEIHRLILMVNMPFSDSQVIKYLEAAIPMVLSPEEDININVEKSSDIIEEIINSTDVYNLYIQLSYTNGNTNSKGWQEGIDSSYREMGVKEVRTNYVTGQKGVLKIEKDGLVESQLRLSQSNGYAKASIRNGRKSRVINTLEHPRIESVSFIDDLKEAIYKKVKGIFKDQN